MRGLLWSRRKVAINRREAVKVMADQKIVQDGDLEVEIQAGREQRKSLKRKLDAVETIPDRYQEPDLDEVDASAEPVVDEADDEPESPTNPVICAEAIDDDKIDTDMADWPSDDDLNYEERLTQKNARV